MNIVREFAQLPLADRLRESVGVPVFVDNDVDGPALGEWMFGAGRGAASMALLALGTGIGGAVILAGQLVRGHRGCAGGFGYLTVRLPLGRPTAQAAARAAGS